MLKRDRLWRVLAHALAIDPGVSYRLLAERTGVSRQTLYRLAASREALFEKLREEAVAANFAALDQAQIADGPFEQALLALTTEFIADADLYTFWSADTWGKPTGSAGELASDRQLDLYRARMMKFFERGQAQGFLRTDMPPHWLVLVYDACLSAAASSLRTGSIAPADLPALTLETFRHGMAAVR